MKQKTKPFEFRSILGIMIFVGRLTGISIDLFHRIEQTSTQHLLSEYSRFVRAHGGMSIKSSSVFSQKYELSTYLLTTIGRWE